MRLRERSLAFGPSDAIASNRIFVPGESVPVVARVTEEELRNELLEAGLTKEEIDEYFALAAELDEPEEAATGGGFGEGLLDAVRQTKSQPAPDLASAGSDEKPTKATLAGPSGIEAIFKMMATNEAPSAEMIEKINSGAFGKQEEEKKDEKKDQ